MNIKLQILLGLSALIASTALLAQPNKRQYLAFVGTYTTNTNAKGIYAYRFDAATGQVTLVGLAAETTDPSFLAVHPSGKYLYAVNEIGGFNGAKTGSVSAFAIDAKSGTLKLLNQISTHGAGPCHVSLDKDGRFVMVANYDGGSVATFPVRPDGSLGSIVGFVQHSGSSVDKERQEAPHAHWIGVTPDNRFALVADLGLDDVLVYKFDGDRGSLTANSPPYAKVKPGSGPRHIAFHPNGQFVYVLNEMGSTVTTFAYQARSGSLSALETTSTLGKDYSGVKEAAEIVVHPSGKFLYVSNRGTANSIAVFAIDAMKGTLQQTGEVSTKGKTPRNFAIDPAGEFLFAANQDSGNIAIFRIDLTTGALTPTGQDLTVPAPVCVVFLGPEQNLKH